MDLRAMTLLCADIGNSHTVLGLLRDGDVLDHWRVATDERRTADEWAVLIRGLLADSTVADNLAGISVCATVPAVLHEWRDMLRSHFGDRAQRRRRARRANRRARAHGQPARGRRRPDHQRARRRPAVRRALRSSSTSAPPPRSTWSARAGSTSAARSPRASTSPSRRSAGAVPSCARSSCSARGTVIAKNTVEALQSGIVFGFASQVDGIVARMIGELGVGRRPRST